MSGRWQPAGLVTCGVISGALGLTSAPLQVAGQTLRPAIITDGPFPAIRRPLTRRADPNASAETDPAPAPAAPAPGAAEDADDASSADSGAAAGDDAAARRPLGLRPATRDGDPTPNPEAGAPIDGAAASPDDAGDNPDGADPVAFDARSAEDAAPFERPPAGYDAELFRSESTPLIDRRPERLFRFEPWQPRGIRIGNFIVLPSVDMAGVSVSNIFRSKPARADQAFDLRPTVIMRSDWRTHAVEFRATGGFSYFDNFPREDDRAYSLEARARIDITRQTQLSGLALHELYQESRGTLAQRVSGGAQRADVTSDQTALLLNHRFNRLSVELRGTTLQRDYTDTTAPDGTVTSNRDRNLTATEQAVRVAWAFKPTFQVFGETAVNQRQFEAVSIIDGISRNSTGERYRLGVSFGNTSQILRGEVSLGYGEQTPDDRRLSTINGMIIDANLAWRVNALNAMLFRASTDVVETTVAGAAGGFARRGALEWRHAFLKPLIGTASIGYSATDYQGNGISENLTESAFGLEYYLAPEAMVFGRLQHSTYRINSGIGNWDGDEIRVGMRLRQ